MTSSFVPTGPPSGRRASLRTRSERLGSPRGGVRERPNRTVSKTVVPHGHRGFKSHLLRSGHKAPPHGRMRQEQRQGGDARPSVPGRPPNGRKGVNRGTRTFDIRKTAARPGKEGQGQGEDGRPPGTAGGQGGREPSSRAHALGRTRSTRPSCSSSSLRSTRTWPRAASRSTTSRYAKRSSGASSSSESPGPQWSGLAEPVSPTGRLVAPLEPTPEPGRVGVHAVHDVELLLVSRVDVAEERVEPCGERVGDVGALAVGLLGRLRPLRQRLHRLGQQLVGLLEQPVVGQRDARRPAGRELRQRRDGLVEVEVRRRRRGAQHAAVGQLDADGVAGEEHTAQRVVQCHVVLGVTRRVHRDEAAFAGRPRSPPRPPARAAVRRAWGRGARRASPGEARRRAPPSRSAASGRPGAAPPSGARRPSRTERPGPRRRRRRHGRGGCG